jgi:hypothetical protein
MKMKHRRFWRAREAHAKGVLMQEVIRPLIQSSVSSLPRILHRGPIPSKMRLTTEKLVTFNG